MGFLQGLAKVQEELAKKPSGDFEDRVKTVWANLPKDGDSAKVVPLQELDESSPNYSEKNGLAHFVLEHSNPDNWQKRAECTIDEGQCYGCEQGWYQKVVLYINVLFDNGSDKPYVAVLSRGTGKGSVAKQLMEIAADSDFDNSVSDKLFKFTRSGVKKDTSYTLAPVKKHELNVEDYDLFDLNEVPFKVKYEKQEAYYLDGQEKAAAAAAPVSASSVDADW
jgi:hypothetical protein